MFARYWRLAASIALAFLLLIFSAPARAQITVGGDAGEVSPTNPATWTSSGTQAQIGINSGKTGTITVAGGSKLHPYNAGVGVAAGSSGSVVVTGQGSTWTNSSSSGFILGGSGAGTLMVQNGGTISDGYAIIGSSAGSSGSAVVTGQGSSWINSGSLNVGQYGAGTLSIENGGTVSSYGAYLGNYAGSSGSVLLTGQGSSWTTGALYVGDGGSGTLTVENGGTVTTGTLYASASDLRGDGTINTTGLVADVELVFDATHGANPVLSFGTGGTLNLSIGDSSNLGVGYRGAGSLRIADGVKVTSHDDYLAYNAGSSGNAVVTGQGSSWTSSEELRVGNRGTGSLIVENGGTVSSGTVFLGYYNAGSSGSAVVNGQGSSWASSGTLEVGFEGAGALRVENGGAVSSSTAYLGCSAGSSGSAVVTGQGSSWTNSGTLRVGYNGAGTLTVENGGTVTTGMLYASASDLRGNGTINTQGLIADSDLVFDAANGANAVLSFGTGRTLNLSLSSANPLGAGYGGAGSLRIADGLKISSSSGYLGYLAGSSGSAVMTGQGSSWTTSSSLYVGNSGTGTLSVENGGAVSSPDAYLGYNAGSYGSAVVTGPGASWTNSGTLSVGCIGTGTLTVENGGKLSDSNAYVGGSGSTSSAVVTGQGSSWTNSSGLTVSALGTLMVGNGGAVNSSTGNVSGNAVVTGQGSSWTNSDTLTVASSGASMLRAENGGTVSSSSAYIGNNAGSNGSAVVTGAGTKWTNSNTLYVVNSGKGTLSVENGGVVSSSGAHLGYSAGSSGSAVVTGTGSSWNSGLLSVGDSGTGTLSIKNGGVVSSSSYGFLGYSAGSSGSAVVTGQGSSWTTSSSLYVGNSGTGTLSVENGGTVSNSSYAFLGHSAGSSGSAVVSGKGSSWTSRDDLFVGDNGTGTLTVGNGGKVKTKGLYIYNISSKTNVHVSGNGMIVLGTATSAGTVSNYGYVNLYADAFLAAGTYSPITAYPGKTISWSGMGGTYNGYGGRNSTAHTFTVAAATASAAGQAMAVTSGKRLLITDSATLKRVGASFGTVAGDTNFQADLVSGASLSSLASAIPADQSVLGAWSFTTNFSGDQALLSLEIGQGFDDLAVWKYSGSTWSAFAAPDLTYGSDGIADFAVTSFGSYAVTGTPVPEPLSMSLLAFGGLALLRRRQ